MARAKPKRRSQAEAVSTMGSFTELNQVDLFAGKAAKLAALLGVVLLAGCKAITPDGGLNEVAELTSAAVRQDLVIRDEDSAPAIEARLKTLLARPLSADAAV